VDVQRGDDVDGQQLARDLAAVARTINTPKTLDETLQAIVDTAQRSVPGIDHVGISVIHRDGRMETKASTDELVLRLDELQYELDEGPCVYAMQGHSVVTMEHAAQETRWPRFMAAAIKEGLRSQLGIQLFLDQRTMGALNLYSTSADTLPPEAAEIAELFAAHAAVALGHARTEEQLREGMRTRTVIGQAMGMLMQRYDLDAERAFEFLVRTSSASNRKLVQVAEQLVESRGLAPDDRSSGRV
jgi:GAF domain-containing protein